MPEALSAAKRHSSSFEVSSGITSSVATSAVVAAPAKDLAVVEAAPAPWPAVVVETVDIAKDADLVTSSWSFLQILRGTRTIGYTEAVDPREK